MLGIDVLERQDFAALRGKRVGLLTHPAGVNRFGTSTLEVIRRDFVGTDAFVKRLELGPPVGRPVQYRISGPDIQTVREIAQKLAAAIGANMACVGLKGSPTIVAKSFRPPMKTGGQSITGATAEEKAKNLVTKLKELHLI